MRANPETSPEALHDPGTTVMAIYPQTTCFYKGVIKEAPSSPADDYEVLFEDPSYGDGYSPPLSVAQRLTKQTFKSCLFLEFQIHNSSGGEEKGEVNEVLPAPACSTALSTNIKRVSCKISFKASVELTLHLPQSE